MTKRHSLDNIKIGARNYSITAYLPDTAAYTRVVPEENGDGAVNDTGEVGFVGNARFPRRELTGALYYRPNLFFRLLLFSLETFDESISYICDPEKLTQDRFFLNLKESSTPLDILLGLHERAAQADLMLKALLLEIPLEDLSAEGSSETGAAGNGEQDEEDFDPYGVVNILAAGLPPMVLITEGQMTFPVRSGLPAGVLPNWFTEMQSVDWRPGDELNFYTEARTTMSLREFHEYLLANRNPEELPPDMALFKLAFGS